MRMPCPILLLCADPALAGTPVIIISARDPMGQPIVSNALAVAQPGGLSAGQVLATVQFVTRHFSAAGQSEKSQ